MNMEFLLKDDVNVLKLIVVIVVIHNCALILSHWVYTLRQVRPYGMKIMANKCIKEFKINWKKEEAKSRNTVLIIINWFTLSGLILFHSPIYLMLYST